MIQVMYAVSLVVAYLQFEQSGDHDKLLRALAVSLVCLIVYHRWYLITE